MIKDTQDKLLQWFLSEKRDMPWRDNPTPYRVWISEIMLQQTTVAAVRAYFMRFMERFPTLTDLSYAKEDDLLHLWAGLGYYNRVRNILKTAQLIQEEEKFPSDYNELLKLPGIGPYTAGAISSIAFNKPVSLIDTNVDRVLGRFYKLNRQEKNFEQILRQKAQNLIETVDLKYIWAWNQAIMELGALLCGVTKANCDLCPLKEKCQGYQCGTPLEFPGPKIKPQIHSIQEYAYIIQIDKFYVISKISQGSRRLGLYDFPIGDKLLGQEISRSSYRISNNKVERIFCLINKNEYQMKDTDLLLEKAIILSDYALTSPCKKFLLKNIMKSKKNKV